MHNSLCNKSFLSKETFEKLASDPDKGGKITAGSIEEVRAGLAAETSGLIDKIVDRGTRGVDLVTEKGVKIDVKKPRADYLSDRKQLLKLKGRILAEPDIKILIDQRDLTPSQLEDILKRADSEGISRDVFIIPQNSDFGFINVNGVDR